MSAAVLTGMPARLRDWLSRGHEADHGDASTATSLDRLPVAASVFVVAVVATGFFFWKGYLSPPKAGKRESTVMFVPEVSPKGVGIGATIQF